MKRLIAAILFAALAKTLRLKRYLFYPPAHGYDSREQALTSRFGRTFDPPAAASVAAEITVSALLEPNRAARLEDFHARDSVYPGPNEVIRHLLNVTWFAPLPDDPWLSAMRYQAERQPLLMAFFL